MNTRQNPIELPAGWCLLSYTSCEWVV